MKKIVSMIVLAIAAFQFAYAGDVITQDVNQLPLTARNFISKYFTRPQISQIKIEKDMLQSKKYEVRLSDRTEIDFDSNGNWMEIDCKKSEIPTALIPVTVKEYVKKNFPQAVIKKIDRKGGGMEVKLNNDFSLKFNKKGQFVKMDD